MAMPAVNPLSTVERSRLATLEASIERGVKTIIEAGEALFEIREQRLYRSTHATFEAYFSDRWGMSRSRAYQLIGAADVAGELADASGILSTSVDISEAAARDIKPILPAVTADVKDRIATGVEPAEAVKGAVAAARPKPAKPPKSEPEPEDDGGYGNDDAPDPIVEWERTAAELKASQDLVESLTKSDTDRELRAQQSKYARLSGNLDLITTRLNVAVGQVDQHKARINRIAKLLGVKDWAEIEPAIEKLKS